MARKRWEDLSPSYRRRLERKGITKSQHQSGKGLSRARGHFTRQDVSRRITGHMTMRAVFYRGDVSGHREEELREAFGRLTPRELTHAIEYHGRIQAAYIAGDEKKARRLWEARPDYDLPEWFWHYHGMFS